MNGTLSVSPRHFAQLFTIHFLFATRLFPGIWALLTHKTEESYARLFNVILDYAVERNIHVATMRTMTDYETCLMPAIQNVLHFNTDGCVFHLQKAIYAWLRDHNLSVSHYTFQFTTVDSKQLCEMSWGNR